MVQTDLNATRVRSTRRRRRWAAAIASVALAVPITVATAGPSQALAGNPLDTTFNGTGKRLIAYRPAQPGVSPAATVDEGFAAVFQDDGKLLVAADSGGNTDVVVSRLNADGSLDATFGSGGTVLFNLGSITPGCPFSQTEESPRALAVQKVGTETRVLVGGFTSARPGCNRDGFVLRLLPNGAIDTTFGTNGFVFLSASGQSEDVVKRIIVRPDGTIVVGAYSHVGPFGAPATTYFFTVARLLAGGAFDPAFSGDGILVEPVAIPGYDMMDLTIDRAGRLVVVGSVFTPSSDGVNFDAAGTVLRRVAADGSSVESGANGGFRTGPLLASSVAVAQGATPAEDRIVVGGSVVGQAALRYFSNADLSMLEVQPADWRAYDAPGTTNELRALALDPKGRLVAAGDTTAGGRTTDFMVARFLTAPQGGSNPSWLDLGFGGLNDRGGSPGLGLSATDFADSIDDVEGMALSADGRAALVGTAILSGGERDTAVAMFVMADRPSAPTALKATPGDGSVAVEWAAPADDGGASQLTYSVLANGVPVGACQRITVLTCTVAGLTNGTAATIAVRATNAAGNGPDATIVATPAAPPTTAPPTTAPPTTAPPTTAPGVVAQVPAGAGRFVPLPNPSRFLDTRGGPKPAANSVTNVQIAGRAGIPANAIAVVMNVTATETAGPGFVTAYPAGEPLPTASNLNPERADQNLPNLVTVRMGAGGAVSLYTSAATHLIADVSGYYLPVSGPVPDGRFVATAQPERLLDTRTGNKPAANSDTTVQVAGRAGIPASVSAVVLNVTATQTDGAGFVTAYPAGQLRPNTSNVNYVQGQTVPNQVIVPVGPDGRVALYTFAASHLIADVAGYFTGSGATAAVSGLFVPQSPSRALDTRTGGGPKPGGGAERPVNVPVGAAVVANVTATEADGAGYVTAYPGGTPPNASNLNLERQGQTIANHVVVRVQTGQFRLFTFAGTHLIADLNGYYTP